MMGDMEGLPSSFMGIGVTGYVSARDEDTVVKEIGGGEDGVTFQPGDQEDLDIEKRIYERLGSHPRICSHF